MRADGSTAVVVAVLSVPGAAEMWDLTVSDLHDFAVGDGQFVVHNCGETGQVDYGNTDLSKAVKDRRIADIKEFGSKIGKRGNYGAALLDDGSIITGRSGTGIHAEEDLLNQAKARGRQILDLYTEREPCASKCAALVQGMNVPWTWAYNDVSLAGRAAIVRDIAAFY